MRSPLMALAIVALMFAPAARADPTMAYFTFNDQTNLGDTISGSFTYNNSGSGPYAVTSFTATGFRFGSFTEVATALTFDGTSLNGSFYDTISRQGSTYDQVGGMFAPVMGMPDGSIELQAYISGQLASDELVLNSQLTIVLAASVVPEPSSLVLCLLGGLVASAVAWRARRPAGRSRGPNPRIV